MPFLELVEPWTQQPNHLVQPNRDIIPDRSHLWVPLGTQAGMWDIAGGWHAFSGVYPYPGFGQQGPCWHGDGSSSLWNETGLYTSPGFGADWGSNTASIVTSHTVFGLVEFESLSGSAEYSILRVDELDGNYMLALDVFPSTKTIRPLVKTSGTNGWTVNNDKVHNEIVINTPLIVAYRYTDGSPIESVVCPIGGKPVWTKTATNVSGGVRCTFANTGTQSLYAHIGGLGSAGSASNFPGKINYAGMVPYAMNDHLFAELCKNPWIVIEP